MEKAFRAMCSPLSFPTSVVDLHVMLSVGGGGWGCGGENAREELFETILSVPNQGVASKQHRIPSLSHPPGTLLRILFRWL